MVDTKSKILEYKSQYWPLIKSLQTGLLMTTGLTGYMSARCPVIHWSSLLGLAGSLFLAIAGSTMLNMWFDQDIDAQMTRTCSRPLSAGKVSPKQVLRLGLAMSAVGVFWAALLSPLYALVVCGGWLFDVAIYTIWLKRRTAWSILLGGFAGAMPVLAGRVFGTGQIDWIGVALGLAVLFWIPTHILTFNMRYFEDYERAGLPTFPRSYGFPTTRLAIAVASVLAGLAMGAAALGLGLTQGYLNLLGLLSGGLLALAVYSLLRPSEKVNFTLFKYASIYMMFSMLIIALTAI